MPPPQGTPHRTVVPPQSGPTLGGLGTDTRPFGADAYPDPPRNWKLSGGLLSGWVVVLALVLGAGLSLRFLSDVNSGEPTKEEALSASQVVHQYLDAVLIENDLSWANDLVCEGSNINSRSIREQFEKTAGGDPTGTSISITNETQLGSEHLITAAVRYSLKGSPDGQKFEFSVRDSNGYCVGSVKVL